MTSATAEKTKEHSRAFDNLEFALGRRRVWLKSLRGAELEAMLAEQDRRARDAGATGIQGAQGNACQKRR